MFPERDSNFEVYPFWIRDKNTGEYILYLSDKVRIIFSDEVSLRSFLEDGTDAEPWSNL